MLAAYSAHKPKSRSFAKNPYTTETTESVSKSVASAKAKIGLNYNSVAPVA